MVDTIAEDWVIQTVDDNVRGDTGLPAGAKCGTVLIADDHAVFREGLRLLMDARGFASEILEAADAPSAEAVIASRPDLDLAVFDLVMPGMENMDLLRRLHTGRPDLKLVVLTASEKRHDLRLAMEAGVTGYIPKAYAIADILGALQRVLNGESFFPTEGFDALELPPELEGVNLSPRQREVLSLIAQGYSNKEIARILDAALPTIKNHVANILEKMGTNNRVAAVHLGRKAGLIPDG